MWMCSSSMTAEHISSAGMFVHVSITFMLIVILGISFSLPISWLFLDIQSAMNCRGPGLYRILMLYWWMCNIILCSHEDCHWWPFFQCYCTMFLHWSNSLTVNAVGYSAMLSGSLSFGNCILYLTCRRLVLRFTPDMSVSRYSSSFSL